MRIFLFVSLLLIIFLLSSVNSFAEKGEFIKSSDTVKKWEPVFGDDFQKALYRTTLDISKHHLTGFIFIKKTSDTSYRILFSNELGMKFFDLEFRNKEFIVHFCFPSLDRKSLLKLLDNDFRIIFFPNYSIKKITPATTETKEEITFKIKSEHRKWLYHISTSSHKILFIGSISNIVSKTKINLVYSDGVVSGINISNPFIKLNISMNLISR
jgi:hypothetical protein